ncbi:TetR/AcrR family transcriptional regulator [Silicimonas sp. MF1-12-2]|uniref:TetR/AcrR family transcriptional regulator n=1 Tax=Silicimonas sp. MF1-12-2 TaxID=3384793 RepID=UPI0039B4CFB9
MPYTPEHKAKTRSRIVEAARVLFNRDGFAEVTIDQVMAHAGLTRGGFYNHFRNKEELYAEAVASFLNGRGKTWRDDAGVDPQDGGPDTVRAMINTYLSPEHARDLDGQCPMIALPSDVARATPEARRSYEGLLRAMIWLYEHNLPKGSEEKRATACVLAALSVGGMVLSRTLEDQTLADEVRESARSYALAAVDRQGASKDRQIARLAD